MLKCQPRFGHNSAMKHEPITAALIAGGRGRRMNGRDKGLIAIDGQPLAQRIAERLRQRLRPAELLIVANRNPARYAQWADRVLQDETPGFLGPMMGLYTALKHSRTPWVFVWPGDAPVVCAQLVDGIRRSMAAQPQTPIHVPVDEADRMQPLFGLYHQQLLPTLEAAIAAGHLALGRWARAQRHTTVPVEESDCFINLNRPEELAAFSAARD